MDPLSLQIIAHRGFSGVYPENTLLSIQKALDVGASWIEIDIHLSRDGRIVVIHDSNVNRTTDGHGNVCDMTSVEIKALDAGSWKDPAFSGESIPFLDEVLELVRERARINIEIKCGHAVIKPLNKVLELCQVGRDVKISCFDLDVLKAVKGDCPGLAVGALLSDDRQITAAYNMGFRDFHLPIRYLNRAVISRIKEFQGRSFFFTVNNHETMERCIDLGVDGIFTDWPDKFLGL
jgi:glycerophosphoryl diester phosphodiesterase